MSAEDLLRLKVYRCVGLWPIGVVSFTSFTVLMVLWSPCDVMSSPVHCSPPVYVCFAVIPLSKSIASILFLPLLSVSTFPFSGQSTSIRCPSASEGPSLGASGIP